MSSSLNSNTATIIPVDKSLDEPDSMQSIFAFEPKYNTAAGAAHAILNQWRTGFRGNPNDFTRLSLANASLNALRADLLCTTANDDVSKEIQEILDHYGDQVPDLGIGDDGFLRAGTVVSDAGNDRFAASLVTIADLLRRHHGHTAIEDDVSIFGFYCKEYCKSVQKERAETATGVDRADYSAKPPSPPNSDRVDTIDPDFIWELSAGFLDKLKQHYSKNRAENPEGTHLQNVADVLAAYSTFTNEGKGKDKER